MAKHITKSKNLLQQYDNSTQLYRHFLDEIEHQIKSIMQNSQINCNAITSRLKSRESVIEKIARKQGKYSDLSDITDIAGVRIIAYYSEDVDRIAEIIEDEFDVDRENSIDKRESLEPDRFGYCSVHYVVKMSPKRLALPEYCAYKEIKCEIQIRSALQHAWAEIEHDIGYKSEITIPKEMRRNFSRIAGLLEIADKEFNQIRQALVEYRNSAQTQIADHEFLDRELDAVILEVMIDSNPKILALNQYISGLFKEPLDPATGGDDFKDIICRLNWVGIKTVQQLNEALNTYSELAMQIALELLQDYHNEDPSSKIKSTIALFYLCYAALISDNDNGSLEERIEQYFEDTNLELPEDRREAAHALYRLKYKFE